MARIAALYHHFATTLLPMASVELRHGTLPFLARRLRQLLDFLSPGLFLQNDTASLVASVEKALPSSLSSAELLLLVAELAAARVVFFPDYALLAGRIEAFRTQRLVEADFAENFQLLASYVHPKTRQPHPLVDVEIARFVHSHADFLNGLVVPKRDFDLAYFGMKTLQKAYLLRMNDIVAETPQYMFLRVAVGIHYKGDLTDLDRIAETYTLMSKRYMIHSLPTLFNAATPNNFLLLCFLVAMEDDSIDGIYRTLHKTALISKGSGGIGLHVHNIRSNGSLIKTSNGTSSGLVPMLRVFNNTARYVDQGGNKRPGAIAVYIEPWHADIEDVLDLRKNHGKEEARARDLFYALWVPDLFMKRVKENGLWSLFSPDEAPRLSEVHGEEFEKLFLEYESQGLAVKTMEAQKLWSQILESQTETGMPFMLYKDLCNQKLNQKNLGTIKSSNLCCEIVEYSSPEEIAVCNLGLLALPSFVDHSDSKTVSYDFDKLHLVTKTLARNLDAVIDATKYPVPESEVSNKKHRPIAIGVQGLADVFLELRIPFDSPEAAKLNRRIFETIYHGAVESSLESAIRESPYESFQGSPASKGLLQFDLWNLKPEFFDDWDDLKEKIKQYGLRNSLLCAPMPTASTSQILGFTECFEPVTSNIYLRRVLSGEFQVVNKYLLRDLIDLGIWTPAMKDRIIMDNGLIQDIQGIPLELKKLYKTVWEISQKVIVDMAADRGRFIDQLQSMNIFLQNPTFGKLTSCHFYAWEKGLKTGMYYLRTQGAARAIQFTIDHEKVLEETSRGATPISTKLDRKVYVEKRPTKRSLNELEIGNISTARPPKVARVFMLSKEPVRPSPTRYNDTQTTNSSTIDDRNSDSYDIYSDTPVSCNLSDPENCDACSG